MSSSDCALGNSVNKAIFVLSGGALTVSLGIFLRDSAPDLTPSQLFVLRCSWLGLFAGMAGFATVVGIMIVQAFVLGESWRGRLEGKGQTSRGCFVKATVVANWLVGVPAFFAFLFGLGALAWLASSVVGG